MPLPTRQNIFANLQAKSESEVIETLVNGNSCHIERIVSTGQITPGNKWYDQERDEWVLLLSGAARLQFETQPIYKMELTAGDFVIIPAHCRHRVSWTHPEEPTVWLAVHFE